MSGTIFRCSVEDATAHSIPRIPRLAVWALFFWLCIGTHFSFAQSLASSFTATAGTNSVLLTWSMPAGNTCNGITISRSSNDSNYAQIGAVFGICGNDTSDVKFTFTDTLPIPNQRNYYRLDFGGFSTPAATSVFFLSEYGIATYPNPANNRLNIQLANTWQGSYRIQVISMAGSLVFDNNVSGNPLEIDTQGWPAGIFTILATKAPGAHIKQQVAIVH